jgi:hypothetical protein
VPCRSTNDALERVIHPPRPRYYFGLTEEQIVGALETTTAWAIATFGGSRNYSERVPEPDGEYVGVRARIAASAFLTASARERSTDAA